MRSIILTGGGIRDEHLLVSNHHCRYLITLEVIWYTLRVARNDRHVLVWQLPFIDAVRSKHKSQEQYLGYMMHSSLLVGHVQKLAHVVRTTSAVSSNRCGGIPGTYNNIHGI